MGIESRRNDKKNAVLEKVMQFLSKEYDADVKKVGTSAAMMPAVDEDGEEFYYKIQISVPRGARNGEGDYTPYNGYEAAEEYAADVADKQAKREIREKKKAAAIAAAEAKRAAKATIKELNTIGLKKMIEKGE